MGKYLARFWVDVEIKADNLDAARKVANRTVHDIGFDSRGKGILIEVCDETLEVQFERFLKVDDEYVRNVR